MFGGHMLFLWGHWYPCFALLVMSPLSFKARVGNLICTWHLAYVLHVSWDAPLVWHLPISWQPAWLASSSLPQTCDQIFVGTPESTGKCSTNWALLLQLYQWQNCVPSNVNVWGWLMVLYRQRKLLRSWKYLLYLI